MKRADKIVDRVLYGVDAVIFNGEGRVLMLERRAKGERFRTGWEFVKGALKAGESHLDAALREIKEETNAEVGFLGEIAGTIRAGLRPCSASLKEQKAPFPVWRVKGMPA